MWPFRKRRPKAPIYDLVVVGLGNPGPEYRLTRHNIGFRCVDQFATDHGLKWEGRRGPLVWAEGRVNLGDSTRTVLLAKPRTFMNLSGDAVRYITSRWHVPENRLLIIYDEMDLPLGALRLRAKGSAGGHNGIRSVISALGTEEVPRIRIGIGRDASGRSGAVERVLGKFDPDEQDAVAQAISTVSEAISQVLAEGLEPAMNRFN